MPITWSNLSFQGRSSLHLTHVTFSPNGEEVLLSYSGEHVYLMDVNHGMFRTKLQFEFVVSFFLSFHFLSTKFFALCKYGVKMFHQL